MNRNTFTWRIVSWSVLLCAIPHLPAAGAEAGGPLKVICASRAAKGPVIDGVLDDVCWKRTELRSDFLPLAGGPMKRRTTMRFVFDDENLYMGMECYWDDIEILKKGVAGILKKYGPPPTKGISKQCSSTYGAELFLDPGATKVNYCQILFNAAGQHTGNYKNMIKGHSRPVHAIKSTIRGNVWSVELAYPHKGIRVGDAWGLNLCRSDESYYSIWKDTGRSHHEPARFGTLLMGDYAQWWNAAWQSTDLKARLRKIGRQVQRPESTSPGLEELYELVMGQFRKLEALAAKRPPRNRENFEVLYRAYASFQADFLRLNEACSALESTAQAAGKGPLNYAINESFDEWVWRPITFAMARDGRKVLARGERLNYEYRGPLFRLPKSCAQPFGRMVEGKEAFVGRSVLVEAGPQGAVFGNHGPPGFYIDPAKTYRYQVALKGKGTFYLRAWAQGVNPYTGQVKWLGFPNLATVKVSESWKVYAGTFNLPPLDKDGFKIGRKVRIALPFSANSRIYVDDLRVYEAAD